MVDSSPQRPRAVNRPGARPGRALTAAISRFDLREGDCVEALARQGAGEERAQHT
jgi:hypothetical protein